jgi:putrescine aminotransferase
MLAGLRDAVRGHEAIVTDVRGRGLLIALEFADDALGFAVSKYLFDHGVLVAGTLVNARVIRVEPPLTIERAQADAVFSILKDALEAMSPARVPLGASRAAESALDVAS